MDTLCQERMEVGMEVLRGAEEEKEEMEPAE